VSRPRSQHDSRGPEESRRPEGAPEPRYVATREGYDAWAPQYDSDGNPIIALDETITPALLPDLKGKRVLDLGCGTGRHTLRLAQMGGIVTGADFSAGMLAQAAKKPGTDRVTWVTQDLNSELQFMPGSFDVLLCALVLDHIRDLDRFFGRTRAVCGPGGVMVISVMHPAMMLRGVQARFYEPRSDQEIRIGSEANLLSDYVMAALDAGWRIDHLGEHGYDEELAANIPRAKRYVGWPMLLTMRVVR